MDEYMSRKNLIAKSLAAFISDLSFDEIPENVVEQAKNCILDSVACILGGLRTDIGKITLGFAKNLGESRQSSIIGLGYETSCTLAAFVNSTMANVLDFDDTYYGHPGATVIPPALSFAEFLGSSGKDLLCSIVAGYEVSIRIGKAIQPSPKRFREVKGIATWQIFGAVSAIGKLMKLDLNKMGNALGIAGAYAPVPAVIKVGSHDPFPMTMVKNPFGLSSMAGGMAVMLAKRGFTGPTDIFDGDEGFWKIASSDKCNFEAFTQDLGKAFEILNVAFKPYSCCRYIHAALDACLAIQRKFNLNPADIEEIIVKSLSRLTEWKPFGINDPPRNMVEAQFCPAYDIAIALFGIPPGPEWFTTNALNNHEILKLASKIKILPDDESDKISYNEHRLTATAYMKTSRGNYEYRVRSARGEKDNPVTKDWIENKFRNLASPVLSKSRIEDVIRIINNIEKEENVRDAVKELSSMH